MFWIHAQRTVTKGQPIAIDCPVCHATGTPSVPRLLKERLLLLHLIPLFTLRSTFIDCGACGRALVVASRDLDDLYRLSPSELAARMRPYVSFVGKFLVVCALVLFWFPFLATALAAGGLLMTWRHPLWRRLAVIAVCLSFLVPALVIFAPGL